MGKITCATCRCEVNRKCNAKKGRPSVAINKRRRCDKYILEASKVKEKHILKSVRVGYREKEALRREYKRQLKQFRSDAKHGGKLQENRHPITGDLNRFTSTAGKDRGSG